MDTPKLTKTGSSSFLDTSGWIALLNKSDPGHSVANEEWKNLGRRRCQVTVTDWIVAETGNGLARQQSPIRAAFIQSTRPILASSHVHLVYVDVTLMTQALELYGERSDKSWGLVDCASIIVMRQKDIQEVFGSDHHFTQAGMRCLLRRESSR